MRRLALALFLGLAPSPVYAQSVTLDVCNIGTVDIDVFVSQAGSVSSSAIKPSTCAPVAKSVDGGMEPAHLGIAFADARGQWGAARRFADVPSMGVKPLPLATRLAMSARGEPTPSPVEILSAASATATVRRGAASVALPMGLRFEPRLPECRNVATGDALTTTTGRTQTTLVGRTTVCEDLVYTLRVLPYADSREASLGTLPTGGFFSDGALGATIINPRVQVDWAEEAAERKTRESPQPIVWTDLLASFRRALNRDKLSSGEQFTMPGFITVRGTVSAVEIRQTPVLRGPDRNATIPVAEINFRESPPATGPRPYPDFNVCTTRLDILQEVFGADYRTSMIGKVIEVHGRPRGDCWAQIGEIEILLARQVRQVPSVQFAAGTRVWVPPPVYVPPPRPAPTAAEVAANDAGFVNSAANIAYSLVESRARTRLIAACGAEHERAITANPGNRVAIDNQYAACRGAVNTNARAEAVRGQQCARDIVGADLEGFKRDQEGTWQKVYDCTAASTPTPAPAAVVPRPVTPAPAVALPTPGSRLAVTPAARAGALPISSITAQWVGRSVVATGTVARVEAIRGVHHVYFEGAGEKYVLCIRAEMPGMQHPSELVGKTLELSVRVAPECMDRRVTIGATELRQPTQLRVVDGSLAR
jgi:hypothetical protein